MKAYIHFLLFLFQLSFISLTHSLSTTGRRLLVVVDNAEEQSKYSHFWKDLEARQYEVSFENPKSESLSLFRHGSRQFDHLILLPSRTKGLGPSLNPKILLHFLNEQGNVLLALSGDIPTPTAITSLLLELDIHLPASRTSVVVDHFNFDVDKASDRHDVLLIPTRADFPASSMFFGDDSKVAFPSAVPQEIGSATSLSVAILRATESSYIYDAKQDMTSEGDPEITGEQLSLVTALQARNSARLTVFGSAEALQDKWFDTNVKGMDGKKTKSSNRAFAKQISLWTFQETGVLKVGRVSHHLNVENQSAATNDDYLLVPDTLQLNPQSYRIKSKVTFSIDISEYKVDHFEPFEMTSPNDAVQVEFSMLSPYQRLDLIQASISANSTTFQKSLCLPDQHGIFKFKVHFQRPFYTKIDVDREVTVRHFAHDEWPRSWQISGGRVWIAGLWTTIVGWVVFVAIWLWSKPVDNAKKDQ